MLGSWESLPETFIKRQVTRCDCQPSFLGNRDKSGKMVDRQENIVLYWIAETSQGRKILSCTRLIRQAKAGKYYLVLERQDKPRQENILLYRTNKTSQDRKIFSCTGPTRLAKAGKYSLVPGPREQPRQEIILLNRTIETSLGKKLQYSLVPDRRD